MSRPQSLIFWLLIAATISIDVVAFSHIGSTSSNAYLQAVLSSIICDALLASQISVVCIWAVLGNEKVLWLPVVSALFAATTTASVFDVYPGSLLWGFHLYLNLYGFETAVLVILLWFFRGAGYWRRRTGVEKWRFSLAQLLIIMTAACVSATLMRTGPFAEDGRWENVAFALSVVAMALMSAVIWSFTCHWLLQFAATIGVGLVLGWTYVFIDDLFVPKFGSTGYYIIGSHFLVQAIVLSAWLGWGPILPPRVIASNVDVAPQPRAEY